MSLPVTVSTGTESDAGMRPRKEEPPPTTQSTVRRGAGPDAFGKIASPPQEMSYRYPSWNRFVVKGKSVSDRPSSGRSARGA